MNIKRFDRKGQWGIDSAKRYFHREFSDEDFSGVIALLYFDQVDKPSVWNYTGNPVKVCDKGMKWLQFIPRNENYAVKAMIDEGNIINLWYIDVIANYGYTEDNVVYFTDLGVDIILYPDGEYITDESNEELKEALAENDITQEQFELALEVKSKLLENLDPAVLSILCMKYLDKMEGRDLSET